MFRMLLELVGNASYSHVCVQARNAEIELARRYRMINNMNGRRFKCGPHKWRVRAAVLTSSDGRVLQAKLIAKMERSHGR